MVRSWPSWCHHRCCFARHCVPSWGFMSGAVCVGGVVCSCKHSLGEKVVSVGVLIKLPPHKAGQVFQPMGDLGCGSLRMIGTKCHTRDTTK